MALLGINVAPDANPAAIAATGAKLVRVVYRDTIAFRPWLTDLKNRGVECWFVGDSSPESLSDNEGQWAGRMTVARSNYGDLVKRWTWGNEPDGTGMASWTMSWQRVNRLLDVARSVFPRDQGYILSTPGLVSGDTNWPAKLRFDLCDLTDAHLYAQFIDNLTARANLNGMLDRYRAYGLPVVVGEYDSRTPGLSAYFRDYPGVAAACVFCWDDGMTIAEGIRLGLRQNPAAYSDFVAAAKEPIVPPAPALIRGIDVSNYQPADVTALVAQYNAQHVVVRASTESDQHRQIARQQCVTAQQAGCSIAAYIWAYFELDPVSHVKNALATVQGFDLATVWVDCEDGSPGSQLDDWLSRAVAQIEHMGYRAGIYTGTPWWRAQGDSHGFTRLPLWIANYNGQATLDGVPLPGGWISASGHQYAGDPVDQNVFVPAVTVPRARPRFQQGFAAWAALEPALIGEPLDPEEWGAWPGCSAQRTTNGLIQWANLATVGPVLWFVGADGRRFRWREGSPASEEVAA